MWPWPFDFGQWSYMAGYMVNPSTKLEDPRPIHSWIMSSGISHKIPLRQCVCSHCACTISRDLCVGGKFSPYILNPWPWFAYSLYSFYGATTFKGHWQGVCPMSKWFSDGNFYVLLKSGPKLRFWEGKGCNVKFWFCDAKKAHPRTEPRLLTYIASMSVVALWLWVG